MLSPVSSRVPQSKTPSKRLYAQQVPVDTGKVTEIYLDALSAVFIKVVVTNDQTVGGFLSNTEYWYASSAVSVTDAPLITLGSQAGAYDAAQIQQFLGATPLAFTWTQVVGTGAWTKSIYKPTAAQARLFKATDPDDPTRRIGLLIEQDSTNKLKGITWYKQVNTGKAFNVTPTSLSLAPVFDSSGNPSTDPNFITPSTWYYVNRSV